MKKSLYIIYLILPSFLRGSAMGEIDESYASASLQLEPVPGTASCKEFIAINRKCSSLTVEYARVLINIYNTDSNCQCRSG